MGLPCFCSGEKLGENEWGGGGSLLPLSTTLSKRYCKYNTYEYSVHATEGREKRDRTADDDVRYVQAEHGTNRF